jgi:hypothetical protein
MCPSAESLFSYNLAMSSLSSTITIFDINPPSL